MNMTEESREEKRFNIYSKILIAAQIMPSLYATVGDFMDEFESVMLREIGSCTEEDLLWCNERLAWIIKRMSKPEKKKKGGKADGHH